MSLVAVRPDPIAPADWPRFDAVPVVELERVQRRFDAVEALQSVDLDVVPGEIHALLGPNGAGKTTLMRIVCGLVEPTSGSAYVLDRRPGHAPELRARIGVVPSGDRSLYLRLSGLENLTFFARLHGLRRRAARARATELLAAVGLADAAPRAVNTYSHGMQKRLSFARALIGEPPLLLVDEATHDLDPVAAEQIRDLTSARAHAGAAVLWATQRIEELSGFAHRATVLDRGVVRFAGSVDALAAIGGGDRHLLTFGAGSEIALPALDAALGSLGRLDAVANAAGSRALLTVAPGGSLGAALAALVAAGAEVVACRDERSPIERAFLSVTAERAA
jgi:ABC-2 type transport system ATP-binding protein